MIAPCLVLTFFSVKIWREVVSPSMTTSLQGFTALRYSPDGQFLVGIALTPQQSDTTGRGVTTQQQSEMVLWNAWQKKLQFRRKLDHEPAGLPVFSNEGFLRLNTGTAFVPPRAWQSWDNVTTQEQKPPLAAAAPLIRPSWQSVYPVNVDGFSWGHAPISSASSSTLEVRIYEGQNMMDVAEGVSGTALFSIPLPAAQTDMNEGLSKNEFFQRKNLLIRHLRSKQGNENTVEIWDIARGKRQKSHSIGNLSIRTLSSDGRLALATPFYNGTKKPKQSWWERNFFNNDVVLLDVSTGRRLKTWKAVKVSSTLIFSPDAKRVLLGGDSFTTNAKTHNSFFQLLDIQSGKVLWTNTFDNFFWSNAAFSPDARLIATIAVIEQELILKSSGAIILWDARTGKHLMSCGDTNKSTLALTFSPDSRTLAYSEGNKIRFVDVGNLK